MLKKIYHIVLILCSIVVFGQVNIYADTDRKEVRTNEAFTLTITLEVRGTDFVQESNLKLPDLSKFNIIGTGSDQETFVDKYSNTLINRLVYAIALEPKKAGITKIGSALVQFNGKMYKTEPFDIWVKEGISKDFSLPGTDEIYFSMEVEDREIYLNQPTIAVLKAYSNNYNNLRNIGKITLPEQDDVAIYPMSFKKSDIEQDERTRTASQVVAVAMIIPKNTGNIVIKPVSIDYNEQKIFKLQSNRLNIKVKEFPKGKSEGFQEMVGKYTLDLVLNENADKQEVNKPISVLLKLTGEGNFDKKKMPKLLKSNDYTFYEPKIISNVRNTLDGRVGELIAEYIVIPKVSGNVDIMVEDFSYFNPNEDKYIDLGMKKISLNVLTTSEILDSKSTIEKVNDYTNNVLKTVAPPIVDNSNPKKEKYILNYFVISCLLVFLFLAGLYIYRKNKRKNKMLKRELVASVQDIENEMINNQNFDWETNIIYLKKILYEEKFDLFFTNLDVLISEAELFTKNKYQLSVKQFLEQNRERIFAENYRNLLYEVQLEKYAPFHTAEHLQEFLDKFEEIFREIA